MPKKITRLFIFILSIGGISAHPNNCESGAFNHEQATFSKSYHSDVAKFESLGLVYYELLVGNYIEVLPYTGWSDLSSGKVSKEKIKDKHPNDSHPYPNGLRAANGLHYSSIKNNFFFYRIEQGLPFSGLLLDSVANQFGEKELAFKAEIKEGLLDGTISFYLVSSKNNRKSILQIGDLLSVGRFNRGEMVGEWSYYGSRITMPLHQEYSLVVKRVYGKGKYYPIIESSYYTYKGKSHLRTKWEWEADTKNRWFFKDLTHYRLVSSNDTLVEVSSIEKLLCYLNQEKSEAMYECIVYNKQHGIQAKGKKIRKHKVYDNIGYWEMYYHNGNPYRAGNYEIGKETGRWKQYYENGKLQSILIYDKGKVIITLNLWDEKGNQWVKDGVGERSTKFDSFIRVEKVENGIYSYTDKRIDE